MVFYNGVPFKFNSIPGRGSHTNFIYGVGFSPDGNNLVSVGGDRKIYLYDGKTGEVKSELTDSDGHTGSIFGVSWSKDSRSIVTCSGDRTVKTWDIDAGKITHTWTFGETLNVSDQQVGVVWPNRTDGTIISLSLSGDLNYLNTSSSKPTKVLSGHSRNITSLTAAGIDSQPTLWTGDYEGRLCAWDIAKGTAETVEGEGHGAIISGVTATQTGNPQIFSVGWDDKIRTIDVGARTFLGTPTSLSSQPKAITCTSDSLVVVAQIESVIVYRDGEEDGELPLKTSPTALSAHGTTVAIGGNDSSLRIYTVSPGKAPRQAAIVDQVSSSAITALAFSKDGNVLAAGTANGKIFVYKLSSGLTGLVTGSMALELVTDRWSAHTAKITSIAFSPEAQHAVSGSLDTNIYLWSLKEPGKRVSATNAHKEGVNGVVWLESSVYSVGADAAMRKWSVKV